MNRSFVYGVLFAISQAMVYVMYAIAFGLGCYLIICDCLPWREETIPFFHIHRYELQ